MLHVRIIDGRPQRAMTENTIVRDYLIAHPAEAKEYEQLKTSLAAAAVRPTLEKYTTYKTAFIRSLQSRAVVWARTTVFHPGVLADKKWACCHLPESQLGCMRFVSSDQDTMHPLGWESRSRYGLSVGKWNCCGARSWSAAGCVPIKNAANPDSLRAHLQSKVAPSVLCCSDPCSV